MGDSGARFVRRSSASAFLLTLIAVPTAAAVVPPAGSRDGKCTTADQDAVTLVIDYQAIGGQTQIYCVTDLHLGATGWDVLKAAGVVTSGTVHDGEGFICRLNGRPGPIEQLPVNGRPGYTESCVDTPPTTAYWSYWWARPGGSWTYSQTGVMSHRVSIGGFEGWSFALNASAASIPPPRIPPVPDAAPTSDPTPGSTPTSDPAPGSTPTPSASRTPKTSPTPKPKGKASQLEKDASDETYEPAIPAPGGSPRDDEKPGGNESPEASRSAPEPSTSATAHPMPTALNTTSSQAPGESNALMTVVGLVVTVALATVAWAVVIDRRHRTEHAMDLPTAAEDQSAAGDGQ